MPRNGNHARYISMLAAFAAVATVVTLIVILITKPGGITSTRLSASSSAVAASTPRFMSPNVVTTNGSCLPKSLPLVGQLTNPQDGGKADYNQVVTGVVTGLPPGIDAWIVLYPTQAPAFWPQPGPLALNPAGRFRTSVYVGAGATQNIGENFIVYLVAASPAASARFRAFAGPPVQSQGMSALPPDVKTLETITVTRR
jgi:hypothetical protein